MTGQEAARIITVILDCCKGKEPEGYRERELIPLEKSFEALAMAIETLQQETVPKETHDHEFNLRKEFEMKEFNLERKVAEQELKRGKWIERGDFPYYTCSNCGQMCEVQSNGVEIEPLFTKYCPNCGARMESKE